MNVKFWSNSSEGKRREISVQNLTHWGRAGSFKLFKRPFPGFLTILTL
jgi:hypothetical protein